MDKRSRKLNLFIIVFYLCVTSGKRSSTEDWSTSSQITTKSVSDTTTQLTQTTADYTTPDATNTGITTTGTSAGDPATSTPTDDNETITTVTSTTTNANSTMSNNVTSTPGNNMTSTLGNNMTSTLDTVTSTKTNTNSETSTMSNSLTSTPGGNTTSTLGTESMPRWILTILIPVICGLFLLIVIATIVCHRYHRRHDEEPIMGEQEINVKTANNDVELVRFENEYVDNSKKDLNQTQENENKSPNKECSRRKPSKREGKANIRVVSERGDYDEVSLDGIPGSECESLSKKDGLSIEINQNPGKCQVSAKSEDVLKEDKYYADIEDTEGSSEENGLQIPRSGGNDNYYSDVSLQSDKESSEETENPVYTQPTKHVYSNMSAKWKLKTNAVSSATSENQNVDDNHEDCSYYDYADVNANKSTNVEDETFDTAYDHLDFDRELNIGPLREFTSRPLSDESVLLEGENDNDSNSCREDKNTVGARNLYSKLSARRKHDPEVDKDISSDVLERDDSNRKVAEQEKVMVETDTNVDYNIDKSKDSSKSPDNELNAKNENETVEMQTLNDFAISSQKQDTGKPKKFKEPNSASGEVNYDNINVANMQNAAGSTPSRSVKNDGRKTKGGEMLKIGSKFRIKEISYEEVNPSKCQGSAKPRKSNRSEYEEVEDVLG